MAAKRQPKAAKAEGAEDPSKPLRLAAHEAYAQLVSKGVSQSESYRRVYPKSRLWKEGVVCVNASQLAAKVSLRIEFIKKSAADAAIMDITERKRTLTEIARGRLTHFGTAGADGFVLNVGPENINSAALDSIKTRTEITGRGGKSEDMAIINEIKLRCPMKAIDLLNKMDGVYVEKAEVTIKDSPTAILEEIDAVQKPDKV